MPRLLKHFDQVAPSDAVADAQTGESVNFGKRPQNDNVPAFANISKRRGRIIEELKIGFVKNHDDVFRDARHETVDLALRDQRAGWIVRIGDENQPGFWRDRIQHRLEVLLIIRARRFNRARAKRRRDQFVHDKGVLRCDDVVVEIEKRMAEKFDHFVRAITQNNILRSEIEFRRDCFA